MASLYADWVHETSTTTGTGNKTLSAVRRRFSDVFGTGGTSVFVYSIHNRDVPAEFEEGTGHMSDANTLVSDTVTKSSNSNAAVNFSAGTKDVTCGWLASEADAVITSARAQVLSESARSQALSNLGLGDLLMTVALTALGLADALNVAQFAGASGNSIADSFDALTYVDTAGATNLDTGTAGLLKPTATSESLISPSGLTTLTDYGTSPSIAFDGTTNTAAASCAQRSTNGSAYIGKTLGSAKRISKGRIYPSNNAGFAGGNILTLDIQLRAKTGSAPTNFASDGVVLGQTGTISDTNSLVEITNVGDTTTAFDHWWFYQSLVSGSNDSWQLAEAQVYEPGTTNNLTVTSTTLTAAAAPSTAKFLALVKEVDTITLNTHFVAAATRDGSTYTNFTLTKKFTLPGSIAVYESAELDISGQPSGTSMRWKITTTGNKAVEVHAARLYWRT